MAQDISALPTWPSGRGLLRIEADASAKDLPLFQRACDLHVRESHAEHDPVALRIFTLNRDWSGAGRGSSALAFFELEGVGKTPNIPESPCSSAIDSWPAALDPVGCSRYRALDRESGRDRHPVGSAILHVNVEVHPQHNDAFLRWYVGEHVPAILEAPGMIGARRFESVYSGSHADESASVRRYCTLYEMTEGSVISRSETQEASRRGACPAALEPYRKASNQVYEEVIAEEYAS